VSNKTPVNKVNGVNVNYLKFPKRHCGSHKTSSGVTCLQPCCNHYTSVKYILKW